MLKVVMTERNGRQEDSANLTDFNKLLQKNVKQLIPEMRQILAAESVQPKIVRECLFEQSVSVRRR